jgi:xanthine dehydrogenase large subunit
MLAIGAITALRHAIASFGEKGNAVDLSLPATPEATLRAIEFQRNPSVAKSAAS